MISGRRIYQTNISLEEALHIWSRYIGSFEPLEPEEIQVTDALGRVTAEAVQAKISSPFFHASAMDGYAVRFIDTFGASETRPVRLKVGEQAMQVNTGDPVSAPFNAVIMIEDVSARREYIEIIEPATPYQHIRMVGEDIVRTELVVPENHVIRPVDIGAMLSSGNVSIMVRRRPVTAVIPTGNEIVTPGEALKTGNIIDSNSFMIGNLVRQWGGEFVREDIVRDDKEQLKLKIMESVKSCDLTVVIAGASAGTKDFTPDAVAELGNILAHGISIKPGRPVLIGSIDGKPVIGLPGYPVAAHMTFEFFGRPLIHRLLGIEPEEPPALKAKLSRPVASSLGHEEFIRVKVGRVGDKIITTPVGRGAGALMAFQRADGIVRIPSMSEGLAQDSEVDVTLIRSRREIENTIVCIGSHDNALDVLANHLRKKHSSYSMSSAHVGSMGGIMAIKKSEAHIAGTHLLDEQSGEYNVAFVKKFLNGVPLKLINLAYRTQGLIVGKGNPTNIKVIEDLLRNDVVFINRQPGSGTRLLTDKYLRDLGVSGEKIKGYDKEEFTHMGVASAVASGAANAGMGVLAAAIALELDFIPIANERYDLLIKKELMDMPMLRVLLQIVDSDDEFRAAVSTLGGYDVKDMGKVMYEQ